METEAYEYKHPRVYIYTLINQLPTPDQANNVKGKLLNQN